jgi:hypothetical protein
MEISQWRTPHTFGRAWSDILTEAPTDWGRRARDVYPLRNFTAARYLAVAKVRSFRMPGESGYQMAGRPGRADVSVRVIDLASGSAVCEGDLAAAMPPARAQGSSAPRLKDAVVDGLAAAAVAAPCAAGGADLCTGVALKIDRLAPGAPDPAAAQAQAELSSERPAKRRHHRR